MSKTNIVMGQPRYIIKPDKGIVICQIDANGRDWVFDCLDFWNRKFNAKIEKKFNLVSINARKTFTAVARLHRIDVWNETLGKHIAESKCKKKIYNFYKRLYKTILCEITNTDIKDLVRYVDNLTFCEDREENHFKDLIGN